MDQEADTCCRLPSVPRTIGMFLSAVPGAHMRGWFTVVLGVQSLKELACARAASPRGLPDPRVQLPSCRGRESRVTWLVSSEATPRQALGA